MKNKKIFPKIKKKLKWFLTDESGKITKKDALWLAAWAILLSWAEDVSAWWSAHVNSNTLCQHVSQAHANWDLRAWHVSWLRNWGSINQPALSWTNTAHSSWIVNWHYSSTPNWGAYSQWHASWYKDWWHSSWYGNWWHLNQDHVNVFPHANHTSHWSHGQW